MQRQPPLQVKVTGGKEERQQDQQRLREQGQVQGQGQEQEHPTTISPRPWRVLCTMLGALLLRGGTGTTARPKPPRAQKRTRPLRDAAAWLSEATRLHVAGAPMQEVLTCLEAALTIDPLDADAHYDRGAILRRLGASPPEDALACYDATLAINPLDVTAHVNRGVTLTDIGAAPEDALACHDAALAVYPQHASAHFHRGVVLDQLGEAHAASQSYRAAMSLEASLA